MVRWGHLLFLFSTALFWATVLLPLSPRIAQAQLTEKVQIQSKKTDEFVRIVFRMGRINQFDVVLKDETIEVNFGKRIDADFSRLLSEIGKYVEKAAIINDSKGVSISLKNDNFELRKFPYQFQT